MKKNIYKHGILENMVTNKKDQKLFWKLLDKIQNSSDDIIKNNISGHKWEKHFKSVLQCKTNILKQPPDSEEAGPLDYDISREEGVNYLARYCEQLNVNAPNSLQMKCSY